MDVLGDIGGFFDIINIIFGFILAFYSALAFESHISSHAETDHNLLKTSK